MTDPKDTEYVCEECDGSGWVNCECPHCGDDHVFLCECPAGQARRSQEKNDE